MIDNRLATVFGVLAVLAVLAAPAAPANAAEDVPSPSTQVEFSAKLLVCNACHGEKGVPKEAAIPIIWGLQENYFVKQMHDYRSGDRDFEVMSWMAKDLSPAELDLVAASFAKKNWPARSAGAGPTSPPSGVAVCQICHQQDLVGGLPGPRLAGQSYEYLVEAMRRYAEGERTNNADMVKIMKAISPAEREAMARYMSGL